MSKVRPSTQFAQDGATANQGLVWNGTAWVPASLSLPGHSHVEADVTSLVADLAAKVAKATVTAKGSLLVATASATVAELPAGTDGYVLTADSTQTAGLRWAVGGGGSLPTRTTATVTTASLAANATAQTTITLAKSFRLLDISTDRAARVRLYSSAAHQSADLTRPVGTDPATDAGVILDYVTTGATSGADLSPLVDGSSLETTPTTSCPITVQNLSGATSTVTVTFTYLQTE